MRSILCVFALFLMLGCCAPKQEPEHLHVTLPDVPTPIEKVMLLLLQDAPPARSLSIELAIVDIPDHLHRLGQAIHLGGDHWRIELDSALEFQLQRVILTHEWAHVLQGDGGCGLEGSHGPTFGVAWAAAWRAAVGEEN